MNCAPGRYPSVSSLSTALHHVAHHRFAFGRRAIVKFRIHAAFDPFAREPLFELRPDRRVFLMVGNGAAALAEIDRAVVRKLLAWHAGLAGALVVRAMPRADAERILAG